MPTLKITSILAGRDRRSIGRANEVACLILREPTLAKYFPPDSHHSFIASASQGQGQFG